MLYEVCTLLGYHKHKVFLIDFMANYITLYYIEIKMETDFNR